MDYTSRGARLLQRVTAECRARGCITVEEVTMRVLKISLTSGLPAEPLPLTNQLLDAIAAYNGGMSVSEVHAALIGGKTIYTSFNRYVLE
jgi:hypothetical protein